MFAEHLENAAIGCEFTAVIIFRKVFRDPELLTSLIDVLKLIGCSFVRSENAEAIHIELHHIAKERSQRPGILGFDLAGPFEVQAIRTEIGQVKAFLKDPAIAMWVGAHPPSAGRSHGLKL